MGDLEGKFFVVVIRHSTGKVVKKLGPYSPRMADKIEDGLNINLNHEGYYTEQRREVKRNGN